MEDRPTWIDAIKALADSNSPTTIKVYLASLILIGTLTTAYIAVYRSDDPFLITTVILSVILFVAGLSTWIIKFDHASEDSDFKVYFTVYDKETQINPVKDATVKILLPQTVVGKTDNEGQVTLRVNQSYVNTTVKTIVLNNDFSSFTDTIDLQPECSNMIYLDGKSTENNTPERIISPKYDSQGNTNLSLNLLNPIKEALENGSLALYIGSDIPQSLTGQPSQEELAEQLANHVNMYDIKDLSLRVVCQNIVSSGSRFIFTDFLREALKATNKQPSQLHKTVALFVNKYKIDVILMNFDPLWLRALDGVEHDNLVNESNFSFVKRGKPIILRPLGDLWENPVDTVITETDYSQLLFGKKRDFALNKFDEIMQRNTMIIIGQSPSDSIFNSLLDRRIHTNLETIKYLIWHNQDDLENIPRTGNIIKVVMDPSEMLEMIIKGS